MPSLEGKNQIERTQYAEELYQYSYYDKMVQELTLGSKHQEKKYKFFIESFLVDGEKAYRAEAMLNDKEYFIKVVLICMNRGVLETDFNEIMNSLEFDDF